MALESLKAPLLHCNNVNNRNKSCRWCVTQLQRCKHAIATLTGATPTSRALPVDLCAKGHAQSGRAQRWRLLRRPDRLGEIGTVGGVRLCPLL